MVEISKEFAKKIYAELVCCRRMRERELLDYEFLMRDEDGYDIDQVDAFKDSIKNNEGLYLQLKKNIDALNEDSMMSQITILEDMQDKIYTIKCNDKTKDCYECIGDLPSCPKACADELKDATKNIVKNYDLAKRIIKYKEL